MPPTTTHGRPPPGTGQRLVLRPGEALSPGDWLWTTRAGAELDLIEELAQDGVSARLVQPALVASRGAARRVREIEVGPTFARQGFLVSAVCAAQPEVVADALRPVLGESWALHVWTPDSDAGNARSAAARRLEEQLRERLGEGADARAVRDSGGMLAQVCLLGPDMVALGHGRTRDAQSLAPGGRLRVHVDDGAPSRAAMKLGEALTWMGNGPEPGDVCVDLGAAPGGWTYVLLQRRAHVVAIDPGNLAPTLRGRRGLEHLKMSAFEFEPEIAADWLLCDMAWRPLEVAALLAKWGRKHWARFLVANIKLPMKQRADMVRRVKEIIATGGWTGVKARQLYHDREEITLCAWRGFGGDARAPRRPGPGPGAVKGGPGPKRGPRSPRPR